MTSPPLSERRLVGVSLLQRPAAIALSLLPTPLLLFVSSSIAIYLKNQNQLQYQYQVLTPFAKLSVVTLAVGILLSGASRYSRVFHFALWAYYLTGPLFLLFAFFRTLQADLPALEPLYQTTGGLALWPALLLVATLVLGRRLSPRLLVPAFAVFGFALLAYETGTLLHNVLLHKGSTTTTMQSPGQPTAGASRSLPNIYHFIFDAYQTDLLEHALSREAKEALGGFVYFPNNTAVWPYTIMSLASVFSGRPYLYDRPRTDYVSRAYNSKFSFLYWLKLQEYETLGYVPTLGYIPSTTDDVQPNAWHQRYPFFDRMIQHRHAVGDDLLAFNTEAFWNLWLYGNTPAPLRANVMRTTWFARLDEADLKALENQKLLSHSAPVISYLGFQKMMADEESLSSSGRYTLVHVLIPHPPLKLRADCTYSVGSSKTEPIEQSQCALKLIEEFVDRLKELGRFDDSLIVIHADHGGAYRTKNDTLVTNARSVSLNVVLLVKPVGNPASEALQVVDSETSLLDIAGIIMNSVADARSNEPRSAPWSGRPRLVPLVEGEAFDSAKLILKRQGFVLGDVIKIHNGLFPAGTVIAQNPPGFAEAADVDEVALLLSLGHPDEPNVMPDYVGHDIAEVSEWLQGRELSDSSISYVEHVGAPKGMVVAQTPKGGTKLDGQQEIVFYLSKGY